MGAIIAMFGSLFSCRNNLLEESMQQTQDTHNMWKKAMEDMQSKWVNAYTELKDELIQSKKDQLKLLEIIKQLEAENAKKI